MKQRKLTRFYILLTAVLLSTSIRSQNIPVNLPNRNKPLMFANKPTNGVCNSDSLTDLLSKNVNQEISISLTPGLPFQGKVISRKELDSSRMSMVISSLNYSGYTLSLSRRIMADGKIFITGRMISAKYGDCYELVTTGNHQLLIKRDYYDLINE